MIDLVSARHLPSAILVSMIIGTGMQDRLLNESILHLV